MAKKDIYALARELGDIVAASRATLPKLALEAAQAASRGDIDEDDAMAIYETYIKKSMRLDGIDPAAGPIKANASKLRQIIKCGASRHDAVALLKKAQELHSKLYGEVPLRPLYAAMVALCRDQLSQARPLSTARIVKILKQSR